MEVLGRETSLTSVDFVFDLDSLHGIAYTDISGATVRTCKLNSIMHASRKRDVIAAA